MANRKTELELRRLEHKFAMCAQKGGHCVRCNLRVTVTNIVHFHFDHHIEINNNSDDQWDGEMRDWPPFTDAWFAWAETVDLICGDCLQNKHRLITAATP